MSGITHLRSGIKTVAAPGTPVQLQDDAIVGGTMQAPVVGVVVEALETNEGKIVVGGKDVVGKAGSHAAPERQGIALSAGGSISLDVNDIGAVWIDATVAGDGVSWTALCA